MARKIIRVLGGNRELGTSVEKVQEINGDSITYFAVKRIRNLSLPLRQTIFKKETEALERLKGCENIVHIYHSEVITNKKGEEQGAISMEYIDGQPLQGCVLQLPSISVRFNLAKQLLSAVRYAHNNRVILRDIIPSNILITENYKLKGMLKLGNPCNCLKCMIIPIIKNAKTKSTSSSITLISFAYILTLLSPLGFQFVNPEIC